MQTEHHCNEGGCDEIKIGRCPNCGDVYCDDHIGRHDCESFGPLCWICAEPIATGELCRSCAKDNDPFETSKYRGDSAA